MKEKERQSERRSVGGRTPDNVVPPDTHPSHAVCNYPRPGEIIYECEKERGIERVGTIRTRENCATATKSYISGEGARYDPPYAVENHINPEAVALPLLRSLPITFAVETLHCNHRLSLLLCFEDVRIQLQFLCIYSVLQKILHTYTILIT